MLTETPPTPGRNALLWNAARTGRVAAVRRLLARGASLDATDSREWCALEHAAAGDQGPVLEVLLDCEVGEEHITRAMHISAQGSEEALRVLIKKGADVDDVGADGRTPLLRACETDSNGSALALIAAKANVNHTGPLELTPLHEAARARTDALLDVVQALIEAGADVNARDANGNTPLIAATKARNAEVTSLLVKYGADPKGRNEEGRTAADFTKSKAMREALETQPLPPAKRPKLAVAKPAKKKPAKKAPPTTAAATKAPAKKAPAKKAPAKKAPAKKAPAKKAPATKAPATKAPATKTPATKAPAKKTPAKKTPAKKTPAKKKTAKKTPAKKKTAK